MDFPRSGAVPSALPPAALAAPLCSRAVRTAFDSRKRIVRRGRRERFDVGLTTTTHRRLSDSSPGVAVSSSNSDRSTTPDDFSARLDTFELQNEEIAHRDEPESEKTKPRRFLTAVASATLVVVSSLSPPSAPFLLSAAKPAHASAGGDALITFNKRADAAADAVAGALLGALPKKGDPSSPSSAAADEEAERQAAAALIKEVRDVVAFNYLDTRSGSDSSNKGGGFDLAAWDAAVDAELFGSGGGGKGPFGLGSRKSNEKSGSGGERARTVALKDVPAARRAARRLLAFSLADPYSRFLSPEEFSAMAKYDITGVGLNLGTADEYLRKVGERPPGLADPASDPEAPASPGVWVIGVIRGSPADAAGVRQGDRVVAVDGEGVDSDRESAFDVASRIQRAGVAEAASLAAAGGDGAKRRGGRALFSSFSISSASTPPSKGRGGGGTRRLSLDVLRRDDGARSRLDLEAPVAPAAVSPVSSKLLSKREVSSSPSPTAVSAAVGVVKLDSFNARARSDTALALSDLLERGAESFVLDLRGNRGGLVSEGAEVASLFLEKGSTVATTLGRAPMPKDDGGGETSPPSTETTTTRTIVTTSPPLLPPSVSQSPSSLKSVTPRLTVLVDERTASAGEIVAGALRDNCRAPLVGVGGGSNNPSSPSSTERRRTYGKGLIQSVYELGDGSGLVLTVGKYKTPSGVDIDREGIAVDLEVSGSSLEPRDEDADAVLDACLRRRDGER